MSFNNVAVREGCASALPFASVGRVLSTKVRVCIPTTYLPIAATFGFGALVGAAVAATAGAKVAPAPAKLTARALAARRARQRRAMRPVVIVPLRVVNR